MVDPDNFETAEEHARHIEELVEEKRDIEGRVASLAEDYEVRWGKPYPDPVD